MFDQFTHLVSDASGWAYAVVLFFAIVDAILPIVPSETVVITAGVVAASGDLNLALVIVAAAVGAFVGDNVTYGIGLRYGDRVKAKFFDGEKAQRRIGWAQRQLDERGGELIVVARFIPGGRTAVTLTAGLTGFPWPRFAVFDAIAAVVWAGYAGLLGYIGGHAFEGEAWKGLLLAVGIAFAVTGGTELVRWARRKHAASRQSRTGQRTPTDQPRPANAEVSATDTPHEDARPEENSSP
jgi:membrane protein DedA with SNARE-associated domain